MFQVETLSSTSTLLRLRTDVDFSCRKRFSNALQLAGDSCEGRLIVSLDGRRFFDCSGISALIRIRKTLGSRLKIVIPQETFTYRIFDILGLIEPLEVVSTLDEALDQPTLAA